MVNAVGFMISEDLTSGPGTRLDHSGAFVEQSFIKVLKGTEKASDIDNLKMPRDPHTSSHPNYTWGTPGINNWGGPISWLLLDTGATSSVLTEAPGLLSSWFTTVMGLSGWAKHCYVSHPLSGNFLCAVFSQVSNHARVSLTPSGEGYIKKGPGLCFHEHGTSSF